MSGGDAAAIETVELSRRYGDHLAVDRLSLRVRKGIVFGLLGPNGAGESTVIKMQADSDYWAMHNDDAPGYPVNS